MKRKSQKEKVRNRDGERVSEERERDLHIYKYILGRSNFGRIAIAVSS